jgi:large subunit ribosomal protein L23
MNQERLMKVLLAPHVSEKGTNIGEKHRQYIFKVMPEATKPEIKQAVELMFEVKVSDVQVANMKGKSKRFGRFSGRRSNWKKAYVTLQPGHEIELMGPE